MKHGQRTPKPIPEDQLLVDKKKACQILNVSERTLDRWTSPNGDLPVIRKKRVVLYSVEALKKWISANLSAHADPA